MGDIGGMNPDDAQRALEYADKACPAFLPSQHANAHRRQYGAESRCATCGCLQHRHWLRQALKVGAAAVALGRRGGTANTPAQALARAQNVSKARRPSVYRWTAEHALERKQGGLWVRLEPPYDLAARKYLSRQR